MEHGLFVDGLPFLKLVDLSMAMLNNKMVYNIYIWVCLKMLCTLLSPMVLLIIIPFLNGFSWEKYFHSCSS